MQAYDGSSGWQIQPFGGKKDPELMGEDDLRDLFLTPISTARWWTTKQKAARSSISVMTSWTAMTLFD